MTKLIKCGCCERKFKDEHSLAQHMADKHGKGKRPQTPERYPLRFDDADINAEYKPRQFSTGAREDDF